MICFKYWFLMEFWCVSLSSTLVRRLLDVFTWGKMQLKNTSKLWTKYDDSCFLSKQSLQPCRYHSCLFCCFTTFCLFYGFLTFKMLISLIWSLPDLRTNRFRRNSTATIFCFGIAVLSSRSTMQMTVFNLFLYSDFCLEFWLIINLKLHIWLNNMIDEEFYVLALILRTAKSIMVHIWREMQD